MYLCADLFCHLLQKHMSQTLQQYEQALQICRKMFYNKTQDYGTSWRILRPMSLTDQIYIKALRIRTIEEKGRQRVGDNCKDEFVGIVNYSLMALLQVEAAQHNADLPLDLPTEQALSLYDQQSDKLRRLMLDKNHDYGDAWRNMRVSSFTDLILAKLLRIKQIEDNSGQTTVSEGVAANYADIVNYSIFAIIKLNAI